MRKQCMHIPAALHDSTSANTNLTCTATFVFFPEIYLNWSGDYGEMYSVQPLFLVLMDNYVDVINV
jgi:hypothetical protein